MDFVSDQLLGGKRFRVLTIVDLYSRKCIALHAGFSLRGRDVLYVLQEMKRKPQVITVNNGSEFTSKEMEAWAYLNGVKLDFISPGKPVQNCYIESFNGKFRDECLNAELFTSMAEVRKTIADWRDDYNLVRPHTALGGKAPAETVRAAKLGHNTPIFPIMNGPENGGRSIAPVAFVPLPVKGLGPADAASRTPLTGRSLRLFG